MTDRNLDSSIIGRDADAANGEQTPRHGDPAASRASGQDIAEQLNQTTSEDAGGNVSGTGEDSDAGLDIVFEREDSGNTRH